MSDERSRASAAIDAARRRIDELDLELVALLNRRAVEVRRIGDAKRVTGDPIYQPDREERVFQRVVKANPGPLEDEAVRRLFERILDEARRLERSGPPAESGDSPRRSREHDDDGQH